MIDKKCDLVTKELLYIYDYSIRLIDNDSDEYDNGYVDGVGQCILNISRIDSFFRKSEACKRVREFETVKKYKEKYPTAEFKL